MIRLLLFSFLFMGILNAQKPAKGSSPDNPWNNEVHNRGGMSTYRYPLPEFRFCKILTRCDNYVIHFTPFHSLKYHFF
jgi:hypothetical protein